MNENVNEQVAPEVVVINNIEDATKQEIAKFNITDALIKEVKEQYSGLKVSDINDKNQISTLKKAVTHLQKLRTGLEKKRKELVAPYNEVVSSINGEAKRIIEELQPIEKELKLEEARVKEEIEKAEKEAERLLEERKKVRVENLIKAGAEFDGSFYSSGNVSVDINTIANITDDEFELLIARTESESSRVKEERFNQRVDKIKAICFTESGDGFSLEDKISISNDSIQEMSENDFNQWFGNITKRIIEIEAQKRREEQEKREKAEKEAKASALKMRVEMLKMLGFSEEKDGLKYTLGNEVIFNSYEQIQSLTDGDFFPFVNEKREAIESLKKSQEEKLQKIAIFNERTLTLNKLGLIYNYDSKIFELSSPFGSIQIEGKIVANNTQTAFDDLVISFEEKINDIKAKEEEARKDAEEKRLKEEKAQKVREEKERKAKMSDVEKIKEYSSEIKNIVDAFDTSILKNEEMILSVNDFKQKINQLLTNLESKG